MRRVPVPAERVARGWVLAARRSPWTIVAALATLFVALYPVFSTSLYYQNMIILSLIFAVLLMRPQGLLGARLREDVAL